VAPILVVNLSFGSLSDDIGCLFEKVHVEVTSRRPRRPCDVVQACRREVDALSPSGNTPTWAPTIKVRTKDNQDENVPVGAGRREGVARPYSYPHRRRAVEPVWRSDGVRASC
jgi:hypothetical protein